MGHSWNNAINRYKLAKAQISFFSFVLGNLSIPKFFNLVYIVGQNMLT